MYAIIISRSLPHEQIWFDNGREGTRSTLLTNIGRVVSCMNER